MTSRLNMDHKPSVSIIIPAFNEERYIERTLTALRASDYPDNLLEIIVVDNGSSDNTPNIAKKYADKVLTLNKGNVGAVRNFGATNCRSEILIFLDADCLIDDQWISRGVRLIVSNQDSVFGGPYRARNDANWVESLWLLENPKHPRLQPDLLGGCIFVRADTFEAIKGFNEKMTSGEDSDLSLRLRKAENQVKIVRDLSVVHLGNPQTIKEFFSRQVWHSENYLLFIKNSTKDYMFWLIITFITSAMALLTGILLGDKKIIILGTAFVFAITLALSLKRLLLTKFIPKTIKEALGVVYLDFLYLSARSIGLLKPLFIR